MHGLVDVTFKALQHLVPLRLVLPRQLALDNVAIDHCTLQIILLTPHLYLLALHALTPKLNLLLLPWCHT